MTQTAKHTPGPWIAGEHHVQSGASFSVKIMANNGNLIGEVIVIYPGEDGLERLMANAALIAAAPETAAELVRVKKERDILKKALRKIADCDEGNCEKYVAKVDSIAIDALVEIENATK